MGVVRGVMRFGTGWLGWGWNGVLGWELELDVDLPSPAAKQKHLPFFDAKQKISKSNILDRSGTILFVVCIYTYTFLLL